MIKKRFIALVMIIAIMAMVIPKNVFAAGENDSQDAIEVISAKETSNSKTSYAGGWGISWTYKQLYDDGDLNDYIFGAVLPAGVGFTIIGESDDAYLIDTYSSINVHLAGVWIAKGSMTLNFTTAQAGEVNNTVNVFGGTNTSYFECIGTLYSGDVVTLLAKSGNWYFIEFNDGYYLRKRGWAPAAYIDKCGTSEPSTMSTLIGNTTRLGTGQSVFYAPGSGYTAFEVLGTGKQFTLVDIETIGSVDYALVNYWNSGGTEVVTGYIVY